MVPLLGSGAHGHPRPLRKRLLHKVLVAVVLLAPGSLTWAHGNESSAGVAESLTPSVTLNISMSGGSNVGAGGVPLWLRPLNRRGKLRRISVRAGATTALRLPPGRYELSSSRPASAYGRQCFWDLELPLTDRVNEVVLSETNATVVAEGEDGGQEKSSELIGSGRRAPGRQQFDSKDAGTSPAAAPLVHSPESDVVFNVTAPPVDHGVSRASKNAPSTTADSELRALLNRWVEAVRNHDVDALVSCYAPRMTTYFRKHDVPLAEVRRDKESFFRTYTDIRHLTIQNVNFEENERGLEATLRKTWDYAGQRAFSGEVLSRLTFEKIAGRWVISAERERLVWQKKSPAIMAAGFSR